MDSLSILTALIPLAALTIIDFYKSKKAAIISAVGMAVYELIYSIVKTGGVDILTISTLVLSILFIVITIKMKSDLYFKIQQGILILLVSVLILFFSVVVDKSVLLYTMEKYYPQMLFGANDLFKNYVESVSIRLGIGLMLYSLLSAYAGFKWSKWIKFAVNVPLLIIFMLALMVMG
ncbi:MAG: hypothetical protein JNL74_18300 [Fibrobacteres bacterium]|nr:hypothetical protein [Fibrobacterota bacterium]